jgi:hypothetical protein
MAAVIPSYSIKNPCVLIINNHIENEKNKMDELVQRMLTFFKGVGYKHGIFLNKVIFTYIGSCHNKNAYYLRKKLLAYEERVKAIQFF